VGHCPMGHSPVGHSPVGQCHFNTLSILDGEGTLVWPEGELPLHRGETILVPRPVSEYRLNTRGITALRTFL
jgi:mannose-6-phosphate isomerase class I